MTSKSRGRAGRPSSSGFPAKLVRLVGRNVAGRWLAILRRKGRQPRKLERRTNRGGAPAAGPKHHKETS
jgi:hypothetical protein